MPHWQAGDVMKRLKGLRAAGDGSRGVREKNHRKNHLYLCFKITFKNGGNKPPLSPQISILTMLLSEMEFSNYFHFVKWKLNIHWTTSFPSPQQVIVIILFLPHKFDIFTYRWHHVALVFLWVCKILSSFLHITACDYLLSLKLNNIVLVYVRGSLFNNIVHPYGYHGL